ncbi:tetratricopeptide repeat protein [Gillisia sp. Q332]|uniref:tetratricopeptide repeat-containing sensor histidine kinase n=1 Tax=Gillisia xinjiangensis TaxID=3384765 RepID=UPI00391D3B95
MKSPYQILCVLFLAMSSACVNQIQDDEAKTNNKEKDSANHFFQIAKNEDDIRFKIQNLNQALSRLQNKKDTLQPLLLDYKIYYHNQLKEYDSALFFADSLLRLASFQKDTKRIALAFYRKAINNRDLDNQEAVFKNFFKARQLYLQLGDSTKAARRGLDMAVAQSRMQDYTGSQESATEALQYLREGKDNQYLSGAYNIIAITYSNQGFYKDAIKEYKNALRFSTKLEDSLIYQNNIGLVYQYQEEYEKAISVFDELYRKVSKNDFNARARFLDNLAFAKWLQDENADVSSDLIQALQWRHDQNDHSSTTASYEHLSRFYENRDNVIAISYAEKWLETGKENNNLQAQIAALKQLLFLNPGDERYVSDYIQLNDSLNKANLQAKNTFAKIRYDEERKQQQISGLETSAALQALENQEIKTRNYLLFFFAVLVIGLAVFIIYHNRQRHKKEKIREIYNTETRISKVIHDELANDVYNLMSGLEAIAPSETMDKLEHIYSRTRNISRENSEIDTGPAYLDHLTALLSAICPEDSRLIISGEKTISWDDLNPEKKFVVYRVLQEIMVNMKKHSRASLVALVFSKEEKYLKIDYSDNGEGATKQVIQNGNGLKNVENRILSVNGKLSFETEKGKGLKIAMLIPE